MLLLSTHRPGTSEPAATASRFAPGLLRIRPVTRRFVASRCLIRGQSLRRPKRIAEARGFDLLAARVSNTRHPFGAASLGCPVRTAPSWLLARGAPENIAVDPRHSAGSSSSPRHSVVLRSHVFRYAFSFLA